MSTPPPTASTTAGLPEPRVMKRQPGLAALLALVLPAIGLTYVGLLGPAVLFFAVGVFGRPLLVLLAVGFGLPLVPYVALGFAVDLLPRLLAAPLAFRAARAQPTGFSLPVGVYGIFLVGSIALSQLVGRQVESLAPMLPLTEGSRGLLPGDYVLASRLGANGRPQPGQLALYVQLPPDAGGGSPLDPIPYRISLGQVERLEGETFFVEGLDAGVATEDYRGRPVGVVFSRDAQGTRRERIGLKPSP